MSLLTESWSLYDVLDAVLSTDLGAQRCFKFLIIQKQNEIISPMESRSLPVVSVV